MIAIIEGRLMQRFSFGAFRYFRLCWRPRHFRLCNPLASVLMRRTPRVQCFSRVTTSELVRQLRAVDVTAPTIMCQTMSKCGSDKGLGYHNYTTVYSTLFSKYRDHALLIFELGIGTTNPQFASNMGVNSHMGANGRPGVSLRGWHELFPNALVYGADIDRDVLFEEDRIKTFYCDHSIVSLSAIFGSSRTCWVAWTS